MVTDRVSTLGLLVVLSHLYPSYLLGFIALIVIDIMSHWFHVVRYDEKLTAQANIHAHDGSFLVFRVCAARRATTNRRRTTQTGTG